MTCRSRQDGFSLFEVLIGVVIMGLLGTAALKSAHNAAQSVSTIRYMEDAQRSVSALLQELIVSPNFPVKNGRFSTADGNVTWKLNVIPLQLSDIVRVVVVSISYELETGQTQTLTMWRPSQSNGLGASLNDPS